jgi:hypothetical protein
MRVGRKTRYMTTFFGFYTTLELAYYINILYNVKEIENFQYLCSHQCTKKQRILPVLPLCLDDFVA